MSRRNYVYINEIIGYEVVAALENGLYGIGSPPNSGKSTLATDIVPQVAQEFGYKVLIIAPRSSLVAQLRRLLRENGFNCVTDVCGVNAVITGKVDIYKYKYILIDEGHLLIDDAIFNHNMEKLFKILKSHKESVRILLSGTMEQIIWTSPIWGDTPPQMLIEGDYTRHCVSKAYIHNTLRGIESTIRQSKAKQIVVFCESAKEGLSLNYSLRAEGIDSQFVGSKWNPKLEGLSNEPTRKQIEELEKFYCRILICTSALHVGLNFISPDIEEVYIIGNWNMPRIVQAINRVRNTKVVLHIQKPSNRTITARLNRLWRDEECFDIGIPLWKKLHKRARLPKFIEVHEHLEYFKNGKPKKTPRIEHKINRLAFINHKLQIHEYKQYKEHTWIEVLRHYIPNVPFIDYDKMGLKMTLDKYLSTVAGQPLDKIRQGELKAEMLKNHGFKQEYWKVSKHSTEKIGFNKINEILQVLNVPYEIESKKMRYNKVQARYWMVKELGEVTEQVDEVVDIIPSKREVLEMPKYDELIKEREKALSHTL